MRTRPVLSSSTPAPRTLDLTPLVNSAQLPSMATRARRWINVALGYIEKSLKGDPSTQLEEQNETKIDPQLVEHLKDVIERLESEWKTLQKGGRVKAEPSVGWKKVYENMWERDPEKLLALALAKNIDKESVNTGEILALMEVIIEKMGLAKADNVVSIADRLREQSKK